MRTFIALILVLSGLSGCTAIGLYPEVQGLNSTLIQTNQHPMKVWYRISDPSQPLVVYFEGDGRAFISRTQPSSDPTPTRSLVKAVMVHDKSPNLMYIPRPCQYVMGKNCSVNDWTLGRYSKEMVDASYEALVEIGKANNIQTYRLVGYSGGGAIALLVAARMPDRIVDIRTLAGNLDTDAFTKVHKTTPLFNSINPADYFKAVSKVPQHHYVGTADKIVPPVVIQSYTGRSPDAEHIQVTTLPNVDHGASWINAWKNIQEGL